MPQLEAAAAAPAPLDTESSPSSQAWHDILRHLNLIPELDNARFEVTDKEIIIISEDHGQLQAAKERLINGLKTPENLLASLGVTLHTEEDGAAAQTYRVQYPDEMPPAPREGEGLARLQQFLGERLDLLPGISVTWEEKFNEGPVLLSTNSISGAEKTIWVDWIEATAQRVAQMPLHQLREIYLSDVPFMQEPQQQGEGTKIHAVDPELFKRCFGFIEEGGETRLFCDYQLMHQLLCPPEITLEKTQPGDTSVLGIDKKHLIAYLRQVFSDGVMMQLVDGTTDEANPVLLPSPFSQAISPTIIMMIDDSGSMKNQRDKYISELKKMVSELREKCGDGARLILVPFSEEKDLTLATFSLSDEAGISSYISALGCKGGNTMIYGTMLQLLRHATLSSYDPAQHNVSLIMTTDGGDNVRTEEHKGALERQLRAGNRVTPQMFTLGLGPHHSPELCQQFAATTGGTYRALQDASQLNELYDHMEQVVNPRTLIEFRRAVEAVNSEFVSVYDHPVTLNETVVRVGEEVIINGRRIHFTEGAPTVEVVQQEAAVVEPAALPLREVVNEARALLYSIWAQVPSVRDLIGDNRVAQYYARGDDAAGPRPR